VGHHAGLRRPASTASTISRGWRGRRRGNTVVFTARGLLHPPLRVGRLRLSTTPTHPLRLITSMLDRGYNIDMFAR